jgi:hypothetical protein
VVARAAKAPATKLGEMYLQQIYRHFTAALLAVLECPETPAGVFNELAEAIFRISLQPNTNPYVFESVREILPRAFAMWDFKGRRAIQ